MCHNGAFAVWFLHSKKGGKIQTGLNCGDDSLSKVSLWLVYSSDYNMHCFKRKKNPEKKNHKFIDSEFVKTCHEHITTFKSWKSSKW